MKKILITTTDTIQNGNIERYLDIVSANIVIGTNMISDFKASFTDIFGGQSGTYQKRMDAMRNNLLDTLTSQAHRLGGNAIIGLRIDFDELSGKGTSMLMASATGTAVVLQNSKKMSSDTSAEVIGHAELENQMTKQRIIEKFNQGKLPIESEWSYLLQYPIGEIADFLCQKYLDYASLKEIHIESTNLLNQYFANYINALAITDRPQAVQTIYQNLPDNFAYLKEIMEEAALFDPTMVLTLIDQGYITESIQCLNIPKDNYSNADLLLMQQIVDRYAALPDTGKNEIVKGGILSKTREVFICEKGHKNEAGTEYCQCGINIKGLTETQVLHIKQFNARVITLKALLDNN